MSLFACEKAVDTCPFMLDCISVTATKCKKCVKKLFVMNLLCYHIFLSKYKSQEMYGKVVDTCPPLLKFVPDMFVTFKVVKDLDDAVSFNDNIAFNFVIHADIVLLI